MEVELPEEIWIQILMKLFCKDIINIYYVSHYFNDLCNKSNLFMRRKMLGFPRESGHCEFHDMLKYSDILTNDPELLLDKLYESNYDLIRGDLICFGSRESTYIFMGCKMIPLYDIDKSGRFTGILPAEFLIINDDLPKLYWEHKIVAINNKIVVEKRGIENLVYCFNHEIIRKKCVNNIKQSDIDTYTTFCHNDEFYRIVYFDGNYNSYKNEDILTDEFENFKEILLKNDYLKLKSNSIIYIDENYNDDEDPDRLDGFNELLSTNDHLPLRYFRSSELCNESILYKKLN